MKAAILTRLGLDARLAGMRWGLTLSAAALAALLAGCVQVSAPDKPIEINLNINIKQEVVVRLSEDAKDLIQKNPGVF
jgi:YnbE-like lipoprotein